MGAHAEKQRRAFQHAKPKYSSAEPIAAVEKRVIDSPAFAALPGEAVRVLILLARNLEKGRNGHIFVSESFAAEHGLNRKTLYRSLKVLIAHGLVCMTKRGGNGLCSRYALSWLSLSRDTEGLHASHFVKDAWRGWQPSTKKTTVPKLSTTGGQKRAFAPEPVDKNGQRHRDKNGTDEVIAIPIYTGASGLIRRQVTADRGVLRVVH